MGGSYRLKFGDVVYEELMFLFAPLFQCNWSRE